MNTLQEKMEKEVIALIFRDYPDLRDQILKARVTSRNLQALDSLLIITKRTY